MRHCSGLYACPTAQCCCPTQSDSSFVAVQLHTQDLLFSQLCYDPTPLHCTAVQNQMHSLVQNSLTAALCLFNYTCEGLLFLQLCHHCTAVHCNTVQDQTHAALRSAAVQKRLTAALWLCDKHVRICRSQTRAMTSHQSTAALFRTKCMGDSSLLPGQHRLTAALCLCSYTAALCLCSYTCENCSYT